MAKGEVAIAILPEYKSKGVRWELLEHVARSAEERGILVTHEGEYDETCSKVGDLFSAGRCNSAFIANSQLPGYPASHGCVRLPAGFAQLLFGITSLGLTVVITDDPLAPEIAPAPNMLDAPGDMARSNRQSYRWQPEKSPTGPLSIVLSGRDRRIVVLRNGVEIGSSAIQIEGPVTETMAFTSRNVDAAGYHWLRLPLPGQTPAVAGEMTSNERARVKIPEPLRVAIAAALQPGTTVLVTRQSLAMGGTGKRMTILTTDKKQAIKRALDGSKPNVAGLMSSRNGSTIV
jgi:hypothetical protein